MIDIIFFIFYFSTIFFFLTYYKIISQRLKLIDKPGVKKIHKKPTPLMGGIIIFVLFIELLAYQYSIYLKNLDTQILIAISGLCFFIGIVDDRINIKSYLKLFIIFLAVLFLLYFSNKLILQEIYFKSFNIVLNLNKYGVYFTTLCILLLINAFNLSDGINGLAIIISIHWIVALFFFTFNVNIAYLFLPLFTLIIIGFFVYKEKFFLGDSGSLFISSLIGLMTIYLYNFKLKSNYTDLSVENFFLIFIIPGLDMLRLFVERIFNKRDPFSGDKKHLHHLLIKKYKLNKTLLIYTVILSLPFYANYLFNNNEIFIILCTLGFYFCIIFCLKKNYKS
jgi:UDP-GlcNAc:undecaprenyl-phosphate GlcNAc-1-phosphate transferase